ncbi:BRCA2, helical [Musa troglodytarum]|uniref:BRCA2, helical n=1 Tax=Musa troglodytarum TaxID=320322 RepID=A0A9E7HPS5_9LILI|nr:BRCA2, helical [Musa troglodytarum]
MVKCCITQSGSLPHEVSNMDADNAVTYRFYDASHHDEIGLEAFQVMLLKSGASSSNATKDAPSSSVIREYAVNMFGHQIDNFICLVEDQDKIGRSKVTNIQRLDFYLEITKLMLGLPKRQSTVHQFRRLATSVQDVSVSLAKLEEAYKPEKQTKAAIWQAVSFYTCRTPLEKTERHWKGWQS